jgi:hypothetical protein
MDAQLIVYTKIEHLFLLDIACIGHIEIRTWIYGQSIRYAAQQFQKSAQK